MPFVFVLQADSIRLQRMTSLLRRIKQEGQTARIEAIVESEFEGAVDVCVSTEALEHTFEAATVVVSRVSRHDCTAVRKRC